MSNFEHRIADRPTVFCLHYLGGSAREWARVAALVDASRCIALDLPGFGDAADTPGYTVAEMAASVERAIAAQAPRRWLLAGHSMGAKVATVVARHAADGAHELAGLAGLVLIAGSPPSPEPMDEAIRDEMMRWFAADPATNRADAQRYIARNTSAPLDASLAEHAVDDVLRARRAAWLAWLEHGSREDWSDRVGVLSTPTLIVAGADDPQLGPHAQRSMMEPHFTRAELVTLTGATHLLPLERAADIARLIDEHARAVTDDGDASATIDAGYDALIASGRVGARTRAALRARQHADDADYVPAALDMAALTALRAVIARVVPQTESGRLDLAARIDRELAAGHGDGWRFAQLPPDALAYRIALATIDDAARRAHGDGFARLDGVRQDDLLTRIAAGRIGRADAEASGDRFSADQLRAWFEDLRADAVRAYIGHPRTLARIGYSGIANGGDGQPKSGFVRIGIGEREAWEPIGLADAAR